MFNGAQQTRGLPVGQAAGLRPTSTAQVQQRMPRPATTIRHPWTVRSCCCCKSQLEEAVLLKGPGRSGRVQSSSPLQASCDSNSAIARCAAAPCATDRVSTQNMPHMCSNPLLYACSRKAPPNRKQHSLHVCSAVSCHAVDSAPQHPDMVRGPPPQQEHALLVMHHVGYKTPPSVWDEINRHEAASVRVRFWAASHHQR